MSSLLGHGHPEVANTILEHALELDHLYGDMLSPPVIQLGKRLIQLLPQRLEKILFLNIGERE
jgi:adenosylmethionine-8-amino-7-oxononanoate aminotransferase